MNMAALKQSAEVISLTVSRASKIITILANLSSKDDSDKMKDALLVQIIEEALSFCKIKLWSLSLLQNKLVTTSV